MMNIKVKLMCSGKSCDLELGGIDPSDDIDFLREIIQDMTGIPRYHQRFIFAGKGLEGGRSFEDYRQCGVGMGDNSTFHVVSKNIKESSEIPTPAIIAHGGMDIDPPIQFGVHDCAKHKSVCNKVMTEIFKAKRPLPYTKPLKLTFDLSKLCLPQICYEGISKERGVGFILDRRDGTLEDMYVDTTLSVKICYLHVFELTNNNEGENEGGNINNNNDNAARQVRNRKKVLGQRISTLDTEKISSGKYYGSKDPSETPKDMIIVQEYFPKGESSWKPDTTYLVEISNENGGFRFTFRTTTKSSENDE